MPPVWTDLAGAAAQVKDGDLLALGGHTRAAPMALIRELIRQGRRGLQLITVPTGGLNVDLLVGAGVADRLHFAQVGLEEYGMAPNFRARCRRAGFTAWSTPEGRCCGLSRRGAWGRRFCRSGASWGRLI